MTRSMMRFQKQIGVWSFLLAIGLAGTSTPQGLSSGTPNAALRYWAAFALMQDPPSDKATLDLMDNVASGKASWDESRLGPILDANEEAIQTMQRGSRLSNCEWGVEYELGPEAPIPHLAKARVLGRLNALAGMRLSARGQLPQAISTWIAGVRFARHVAQGGSLISLLSARLVLDANVSALSAATRGVPIGQSERAQISATFNALPESAFDWGSALQREAGAAEVVFQQLSRASDLKASYRSLMGEAAPDNFSLPTDADLAAFRRVMAAAVKALRLSPAVARQQIGDVEASRTNLHPFLNRLIPSLSRVNDTRIALRAERDEALKVVAMPIR
jgi:hypothetical protein